MRSFCLLFTFFLFSQVIYQASASAQISGTKTICPSGCDYNGITAALTDLSTNGMGGAVTLELQPTYTSANEVFPLTIGQYTGMSSSNTLRIQPSSLVSSGLYISGSNATAIINLNNADYTTVDGRPGGTGINGVLSISNSSTSGSTILINNDAVSNAVQYCTVKGCNQSNAGGVITFAGTAGTTGNDNNAISHCDIRDTLSTPYFGIYSVGTAAAGNDNNQVLNCNIYNFWTTTAINNIAGITIGNNNGSWTISGNSIYATSTYSSTLTFLVFGMSIVSDAAHTITNNYIGGTSSGADGSAWTMTGNAQRSFRGIFINASATIPSTVQNNVVRSIAFNANVGAFYGIYISNTLLSAAGLNNNVIGSTTEANNIVISSTSASVNKSYGIKVEGVTNATTVVANNSIAGISTALSSNSSLHYLYGIYCDASSGSSSFTITGNTVGSSTVANSIATHPYTGTSAMILCGIEVDAPGVHNVSNNIIANLNNKSPNTNGSQARGILLTASGRKLVQGNTIHDIYYGGASNSSAGNSAIIGIANTNAGSTIRDTIDQNKIYNLFAYNTTGSNVINGIYAGGTSTKACVISRNEIHTFIDSCNAGTISGVMMDGTVNYLVNNTIRLGIDTLGNSLTSALTIYGIYGGGNTTKDTLLHNSIYIGGTGVSNQYSSYCYYGTTTSNRYIYNNIFENARSYVATSSGKLNGAMYINGTLTAGAIAGLLENNNIYYFPGTGGGMLSLGGNVYNTLAAWKSAATSYDGASLEADPGFSKPTGSSSTLDMHLRPTNPAEGAGSAAVPVTTDIDGALRSVNTPTDIGADAGNFINGVALPVRLVSFDASVQNRNDVLLSWEVKQERGILEYIAERSDNGESFTSIGSVPAGEMEHYSFHDNNPINGKSYYRIRAIELGAGSTLSQVRMVNIGTEATPQAYMVGHSLIIEGNETLAGKTATIVDISGKEVARFTISGNKQQVSLNTVARGTYILNISSRLAIKIVID